jgi:hypothetical protein
MKVKPGRAARRRGPAPPGGCGGRVRDQPVAVLVAAPPDRVAVRHPLHRPLQLAVRPISRGESTSVSKSAARKTPRPCAAAWSSPATPPAPPPTPPPARPSRPSRNRNVAAPVRNACVASTWLVRTESSAACTTHRARSTPSPGASTSHGACPPSGSHRAPRPVRRVEVHHVAGVLAHQVRARRPGRHHQARGAVHPLRLHLHRHQVRVPAPGCGCGSGCVPRVSGGGAGCAARKPASSPAPAPSPDRTGLPSARPRLADHAAGHEEEVGGRSAMRRIR